MPEFFKYVAALIPSTGVGFLFYLVIRAMLEGDRRERLALSRWEASRDQPAPTHVDQSESSTRADLEADPELRQADQTGTLPPEAESVTGDKRVEAKPDGTGRSQAGRDA